MGTISEMVTLGENRRRAVEAANAVVNANFPSIKAFAESAGIEIGAAGQFLNGKRWPQLGNRAKLEEALGWPNGALERIARGGPVPPSAGSRPATQASDRTTEVLDAMQAQVVALQSAINALRREIRVDDDE